MEPKKNDSTNEHPEYQSQETNGDSSSILSSDSESGIEVFRKVAEGILLNRRSLSEKFPKKFAVPNQNDMAWCSLCLGPNLCREIYGVLTPSQKSLGYKLPVQSDPLLSIVLHLEQKKVKLVLFYLHQWFIKVGMDHNISMWLFSLLACLDINVVDGERDKILQDLYTDCRKYCHICDDEQLSRAIFIMEILEDYFQINLWWDYDSNSDSE